MESEVFVQGGCCSSGAGPATIGMQTESGIMVCQASDQLCQANGQSRCPEVPTVTQDDASLTAERLVEDLDGSLHSYAVVVEVCYCCYAL